MKDVLAIREDSSPPTITSKHNIFSRPVCPPGSGSGSNQPKSMWIWNYNTGHNHYEMCLLLPFLECNSKRYGPTLIIKVCKNENF